MAHPQVAQAGATAGKRAAAAGGAASTIATSPQGLTAPATTGMTKLLG